MCMCVHAHVTQKSLGDSLARGDPTPCFTGTTNGVRGRWSAQTREERL